MYAIQFSLVATDDLRSLRKLEQETVLDGIKSQLRYEPTAETRNRKRLEPNEFAEWELRIGKFRVFYNVETEVLIVHIETIVFKEGNLLFIRGRRVDL